MRIILEFVLTNAHKTTLSNSLFFDRSKEDPLPSTLEEEMQLLISDKTKIATQELSKEILENIFTKAQAIRTESLLQKKKAIILLTISCVAGIGTALASTYLRLHLSVATPFFIGGAIIFIGAHYLYHISTRNEKRYFTLIKPYLHHLAIVIHIEKSVEISSLPKDYLKRIQKLFYFLVAKRQGLMTQSLENIFERYQIHSSDSTSLETEYLKWVSNQ